MSSLYIFTKDGMFCSVNKYDYIYQNCRNYLIHLGKTGEPIDWVLFKSYFDEVRLRDVLESQNWPSSALPKDPQVTPLPRQVTR